MYVSEPPQVYSAPPREACPTAPGITPGEIFCICPGFAPGSAPVMHHSRFSDMLAAASQPAADSAYDQARCHYPSPLLNYII